jgi:outer membrane protein assembly factor BamB
VLPGSDAVADGHGGWYVAGVGLGHLRHDGELDRNWRAPLKARLAPGTLQRVGKRLFVSDRARVYALDARTGRTLWSSARARGAAGRILALAASRTAVYVGGDFLRIGGTKRGGGAPRVALAAFDVRTGRLRSWRPPRLSLIAGAPVVAALAVTARLLYVGGTFAKAEGKPRSGVAAVRLDNAGVTAFAPKISGGNGVNAIAPAGRIVLVGAPGGGGAYRSETGRQLKGYTSVFNANAIDTRGSTAYLGGTIRDSIGLYNLLAIDLHTGEHRTWFPKVANYVQVFRIAVSGDKVFVGGEFCSSIG